MLDLRPGRRALVEPDDATPTNAVGKHTLRDRHEDAEYLWEDVPPDAMFQADAERACGADRDSDRDTTAAASPASHEAPVHADPPARQPKTTSGKRFTIADPFILVDGDVWYAYGTGLVVSSSKDRGKTWRHRGHMTSFGEGGARWAPEVHKIGDAYVAYMAIGASESGPLTIYVATSDHPVKGWTKPRPIAGSSKWSAIDPSFFHDPETDQNYLLWKEDRGPAHGRKRIVMQRLDGGGTHLAEGSHKQTLLVAGRGAHSGWERRPSPRAPNWSVEAPTLEFRHGRYWLFYSGAGYEPGGGYAIGAASAGSLDGPFVREKHPLVEGSGGEREPGHQTIVKLSIGGETKWLLFFHARDGSGKTRYLREDQIVWSGGRPHVKRG